jgi:hypothetical protein
VFVTDSSARRDHPHARDHPHVIATRDDEPFSSLEFDRALPFDHAAANRVVSWGRTQWIRGLPIVGRHPVARGLVMPETGSRLSDACTSTS